MNRIRRTCIYPYRLFRIRAEMIYSETCVNCISGHGIGSTDVYQQVKMNCGDNYFNVEKSCFLTELNKRITDRIRRSCFGKGKLCGTSQVLQ
ncbi:Uncharacterised protein g6903 [Pycnogonum litorale]